jgi:hypothetical protein
MPDPGYEKQRRFRLLINDAFALVRSLEIRRALEAAGWEELIQEQITRNGDTQRSRDALYNPYAFNPDEQAPIGGAAPPVEEQGAQGHGNYLSGTAINNPTKMDRLVALEAEISEAVDDIKNTPPDEFLTSKEFWEAQGMD